jgi:ketosteroid isomerase-like protein
MRKMGWVLVTLAFLCFSKVHSPQTQGTKSAFSADSKILAHLVAREQASVEAWNRKDKAFFDDFFADEATFFGPGNARVESMKLDFLPKFDEYTQALRYRDYRMENTHAQVYENVAILTFNSTADLNYNGRPITQASRSTVVFLRLHDKWRVVHSHESINPVSKNK